MISQEMLPQAALKWADDKMKTYTGNKSYEEQRLVYAQQWIAQYEDEYELEKGNDHRLTLRIPQQLLKQIDDVRNKRVGKISRTLWILELIDKELGRKK